MSDGFGYVLNTQGVEIQETNIHQNEPNDLYKTCVYKTPINILSIDYISFLF